MLHAVIMAGGSGTRFWPASTKQTPKQLLTLVGDRSMIQSTSDRLDDLVSPQNRWVVTNRSLVKSIAEHLPQLPPGNILGEPCKRDTAPCVGLAAALLAAHDPDATMLVLPADHVIGTNTQFQQAIRAGEAMIDAAPDRIVTFGIPPTYPAESFGYIERGESVSVDEGQQAYDVLRFREKPDAATAQQYLAAGTFYWNSGIFLWRAQTILNALRQFEPAMMEHLDAIAAAIGKPEFDDVLNKRFAAIEGKSIDYAVMERYRPICVIEAPYRWDDVGSWQALARMIPLDESANAVQGNHVGIDTRGSIIRSEANHTVVTIGIEDLIIVQTDKVTLVAPKAAEERVREAVRKLEQEGRNDLL
jgi:mannose-1-phosphate guanylyltransferase